MGKKRNISSLNGSSKVDSALTAPTKTTNMAATSPVQSQPVFLQVLSQAYESYPSPHGQPLPYDGSPNHLQNTFTVNPKKFKPCSSSTTTTCIFKSPLYMTQHTGTCI